MGGYMVLVRVLLNAEEGEQLPTSDELNTDGYEGHIQIINQKQMTKTTNYST
jgi:hypothetical protein